MQILNTEYTSVHRNGELDKYPPRVLDTGNARKNCKFLLQFLRIACSLVNARGAINMHWVSSEATHSPRALHLTTQTLACDVPGMPDKHCKPGLNDKDILPNLVRIEAMLLHDLGTAHARTMQAFFEQGEEWIFTGEAHTDGTMFASHLVPSNEQI